MHTLKEIKRKVHLMLDQYSENGDLIALDETFYADSDLKLNEAIDIVQRRISVTGKKLTAKIPVVLKNPEAALYTLRAAETNTELAIPAGRVAFVVIPEKARTFSFVLNTNEGAKITVKVYKSLEYRMNSIEFEYDTPTLDETESLSSSLKTLITTHNLDITATKSLSLISGYLPENTSEAPYIMQISSDADYSATISKFVTYADFFPSTEFIPEKGWITAKIPDDIIDVIFIEKCAEGIPNRVNADELGEYMSQKSSMITAPSQFAGIYYLHYYRYPKKISAESPGNTEIELDDFAVDALIFGTASMICPTENVSIAARMNSLYEEAMRNLYNTNRDSAQIANSFYSRRRRKIID